MDTSTAMRDMMHTEHSRDAMQSLHTAADGRRPAERLFSSQLCKYFWEGNTDVNNAVTASCEAN